MSTGSDADEETDEFKRMLARAVDLIKPNQRTVLMNYYSTNGMWKTIPDYLIQEWGPKQWKLKKSTTALLSHPLVVTHKTPDMDAFWTLHSDNDPDQSIDIPFYCFATDTFNPKSSKADSGPQSVYEVVSEVKSETLTPSDITHWTQVQSIEQSDSGWNPKIREQFYLPWKLAQQRMAAFDCDHFNNSVLMEGLNSVAVQMVRSSQICTQMMHHLATGEVPLMTPSDITTVAQAKTKPSSPEVNLLILKERAQAGDAVASRLVTALDSQGSWAGERAMFKQSESVYREVLINAIKLYHGNNMPM
jgi:hypothetical protein